MKEILPGIFQLNLPLPGFSPDSMNVYLIKGNEGYIVIDTGWDTPDLLKSFHEQLAERTINIADIKQVLVTHCHVDHMGLICRYKDDNNARLYINKNEIGLINIRFSSGDNYWPLTEQFLQTHGMPAAELTPTKFQLPRIARIPEFDVLFEGGEEIRVGEYRLKVINTPGHTPGHVSYYEPDRRLLFCGDVLLPTIATNAALHVQHTVNPIKKYLDSLRALKELEIDLVLPGHEYPFSGHRKRIDELIEHNTSKSRNILESFTEPGPKTAYMVSQLLSWSPKTGATSWFKLSDWDKRFAVLQTAAHLEELAFAGKLTRFSTDNVYYYQKVNQV